jgi:hypothetical protein
MAATPEPNTNPKIQAMILIGVLLSIPICFDRCYPSKNPPIHLGCNGPKIHNRDEKSTS